MWFIGLNDWISYGWTQNKLEEYKKGDSLFIDVSNFDNFTFLEPLEAAIFTVKEISKKYPPPFHLFCSGGVDSQSMIYAWIKSGIPFKIHSVKYISNNTFFNDHDLVTLEKFCLKHKLCINYRNFDIIDFFDNHRRTMWDLYESGSPHISTHIAMTDHIKEGTIIFSGSRATSSDIQLSYVLLATDRYRRLIRNPGLLDVIPSFFTETPELTYSFILQENLKLEKKEKTYLKHKFNIILPEKKFTGFEKVKIYYDKYEHQLERLDRARFYRMPSHRAFDILFRYKYDINKSLSETIFIKKDIKCPST